MIQTSNKVYVFLTKDNLVKTMNDSPLHKLKNNSWMVLLWVLPGSNANTVKSMVQRCRQT